MPESRNIPPTFKGIALFTPGGDLIYCLDPTKQKRWHLELCIHLQEILSLSEPPHFLIPCYTATIDQWLDPKTQKVQIWAEAYPPVLRYQILLNSVFATDGLIWQPASSPTVICDSLVIATYAADFPELWENHDLIIKLPGTPVILETDPQPQYLLTSSDPPPEPEGYVLRLYISGHSLTTEHTLQTLHQMLETSLPYPYTLRVIDVLQHPEQAEADHISATPTLIKLWPRPIRRIVGELGHVQDIIALLGVNNFNF